MSALPNQSPAKRRLLLASDRSDRSTELADILQSVGEVDTISTSDIPDTPASHFSGIVVDINLRSAQSVQRVRDKLRTEAYRAMPRLFVLADALHHGSMQAWALGATDTISRPFDAQGILQRIRSAFPDTHGFDTTDRGKALNRGVAAAHEVMVRIFQKLPAGVPLTFNDIVAAENKILKAIKHSSLREWLTTVGCHHTDSYRHARGRPAPPGARRPSARCRQGIRPGGDSGQAGRVIGRGDDRNPQTSASRL
jgi:CheY-like chemotaxis protein